MAGPERLERLTDLVLVLLHTSVPLTLEAIANEVPGYPAEHDARRQAFERDKRTLRDEGIPIATLPMEGPAQFGYRILEDDLYLPDLDLDPDEQAALNLAVADVHLDQRSARDALGRLGVLGRVQAAPLVFLGAVPGLVPLHEAMRSGRRATFLYAGRPRQVRPGQLAFRNGHWYLAATQAGSGEDRTFRVDRIEGPVRLDEPGEPGEPGEHPTGPLPAMAAHPWGLAPAGSGETIPVARVRIDPIEAPGVEAALGASAVVARDERGIVVEVGITSEAMFRSWVLGLGEHAEVLAPAALRQGLARWLAAIVAPRGPGALPREPRPPGEPDPGPPGSQGPEPSGAQGPEPPAASAPDSTGDLRPAKDASSRLRRLLALVTYLARQGSASLDDLADRFGMDHEALVHELEMAACCGVPPYSPDALLEIIVSDAEVSARLPAAFSRPRRLTPAEGFALAASARAILAIPGADQSGALARAADKLDRILGGVREVSLSVPNPPFLAELQALVERGSRIEITYHATSSDETTVRRVDPQALGVIEGNWYLDGHCHLAGGTRRFRVDRIAALGALEGGPGPSPGPRPARPTASFVPGPDTRPVHLWLGPGAAWVADTVPAVHLGEAELDVPDPSGSGLDAQVVTVMVGGRAWLARLLLQAGPDAVVLSPPDLLDTGRDAARRLLALYSGPPGEALAVPG